MQGVIIPFERCVAMSRKCKTLKEFTERYQPEYSKARRAGWLQEFTWLSRERNPRGTWDEAGCRREARRYRTLKDFREGSITAYVTAQNKGWLKGYTWLKKGKGPAVTRKECLEEARKYTTLKDFTKKARRQYMAAHRNGWLKDYKWLLRAKAARRSRK